MDADDLQSLRDELEHAAQRTLAAFRDAIDAIIAREGPPTPQPCPDIETLKRAPEGTLSAFPALWIVLVEARYDRGLTRKLKKLHPETQRAFLPKLGALQYLLRSPRTEPLTLDEVLYAYANLVRPTFS